MITTDRKTFAAVECIRLLEGELGLLLSVDELVQELAVKENSITAEHWGETNHVLLEVVEVRIALVLGADVAHAHLPGIGRLRVVSHIYG